MGETAVLDAERAEEIKLLANEAFKGKLFYFRFLIDVQRSFVTLYYCKLAKNMPSDYYRFMAVSIFIFYIIKIWFLRHIIQQAFIVQNGFVC